MCLSPGKRYHGKTALGSICLALFGIMLSIHTQAQIVLIDFGNDTSFRGVTVANPDQRGNFWTSMQPGLFYSKLVDSSIVPTTIDFGFSTPVGTDSFNGPAGVTSGPH